MLQCYQNAQQQQALCDNIDNKPNINGNKVTNNIQKNANECQTAFHNMNEQLKVKNNDHEKMLTTCLEQRQSQAIDVDDKKVALSSI